MSRDLALLDTNVLIYALYKGSDHYPAARALLDQAIQEDTGFCITSRVLAEFYAVSHIQSESPIRSRPRRPSTPSLASSPFRGCYYF